MKELRIVDHENINNFIKLNPLFRNVGKNNKFYIAYFFFFL